MENPFIVIEGLDGTGKTTLRKSLFQLWQGMYGVTPLCVLTTNYLNPSVGATLVDGKYSPTPDNRDAYLAALAADKAATLAHLIKPAQVHRPVIADRWLISEMAFFAVKHEQEPNDTYAALAQTLTHPADVTFVLETDVAESIARAGDREGDSVRDDWDVAPVQRTLHGVYQDVAKDADSYPLFGTVVRLNGQLDRPTILHAAWENLIALGLAAIPGHAKEEAR